MAINIHSVQVGQIASLGPNSVPSGFVKSSVVHRVEVAEFGLAGDEQADLTVHGGPEKAVYAYAMHHYSTWLAEYPEHAHVLIPGGFGENLTIDGLAEDEVFVGDVHRLGARCCGFASRGSPASSWPCILAISGCRRRW